jgi:4-amino-4-deoxy-L-arabinose transferase-like glycosyltransferase
LDDGMESTLVTRSVSRDESRTRTAPPWTRLALLLLIVFAFSLRLVAGMESLASPLEAGSSQIWDVRYYLEYASEIAAGDWLGDEAFYLAPLYPYVLAVSMVLTGTAGDGALGPILAFQAVLSTLAVILIWAVAARLDGWRTGLWAAVLAAVYEPFVYQSSIAMPTAVILAAHLLALWLVVRNIQRENSPEAGSTPSWGWVLTGAALALAAVSHGTGLAVAAAVLAWLVLGPVCSGRRRRLLVAGLVVAGLLPPLAVITARNYAVSDDLVLLTSNAGKNFYIGHNPVADGTFNPHWFPIWGSGLRTYIQGDARTPQDPPPSEVSSWLTAKALEFIRENPGRTLQLAWRKVRLFLNWYETCQDDNPYFAQRYSRVLSLPLPGFWLIGSLGLAGLIPVMRERRRYGALLVCFGAELAVFAVMFVLARYRAFAAAILIVFAARLLTWAGAKLRARAWRPLLVAAATLAGTVAFVSWDVPGFHRERGFGQQHVAAARELLARGELEAAQAQAEAALGASFAPYRDLDVRKASADALLGEIALARGDAGNARRYFESGLSRIGDRSAVRAGVEGLLRRLRHGRRAARDALDLSGPSGSL